jgi:hypothetical protein
MSLIQGWELRAALFIMPATRFSHMVPVKRLTGLIRQAEPLPANIQSPTPTLLFLCLLSLPLLTG